MKEFLKSVKIWQSYCPKFGGFFFGTQCSICGWIFAKLWSLVRLGTEMNWLGIGIKVNRSGSHYHSGGIRHSMLPLSLGFYSCCLLLLPFLPCDIMHSAVLVIVNLPLLMTLKDIWRSFQWYIEFQESLAGFSVMRSVSNNWASCLVSEDVCV